MFNILKFKWSPKSIGKRKATNAGKFYELVAPIIIIHMANGHINYSNFITEG